MAGVQTAARSFPEFGREVISRQSDGVGRRVFMGEITGVEFDILRIFGKVQL